MCISYQCELKYRRRLDDTSITRHEQVPDFYSTIYVNERPNYLESDIRASLLHFLVRIIGLW